MKSKRKSPKTHPGKSRASARIMYSNGRKMNVYMSDKVQGETKKTTVEELRGAVSRRMAPQALNAQKHSIQQLHIRFDTSYYVNEGGREGLQLCCRPWGLAAERRKSNHRHQERAGISPAVTCSAQRWATPLNNQRSLSEGPLSITIQSASTRLRKQPWWPQVGLSSGSSDLAEISCHSRKTLVFFRNQRGSSFQTPRGIHSAGEKTG